MDRKLPTPPPIDRATITTAGGNTATIVHAGYTADGRPFAVADLRVGEHAARARFTGRGGRFTCHVSPHIGTLHERGRASLFTDLDTAMRAALAALRTATRQEDQA